MRFQELLDREMERLGRTNAELAAASGLGKSTLSRYRRGEREPRWGSPQLWQLAKGLTALGGGDDAELDALHTALGECLSTGLRLDHATYITRLSSLCRCLNILAANQSQKRFLTASSDFSVSISPRPRKVPSGP